MTTRLISNSEISTALACPARHAFAYTGRLTGGRTLRRKETAAVLQGGRAWGRAVAAWHAGGGTPVASFDAHVELRRSLDEDRERMVEHGFSPPDDQFAELSTHLAGVLDHYVMTTEPFENLTRLEDEIVVPVPSRTGRRGSSRYAFQALIDGYTVTSEGHKWLREFKLRGSLTDYGIVQRSSQPRQYAWAESVRAPEDVFGVLVEERLNRAPEPPRIVKAKRKGEGVDGMVPSHSPNQFCTADDYVQACEDYGVEPDLETFASLRNRRWVARHPIVFRPDELREVGRELTGLAHLIRDLDSGKLPAHRNAHPGNCPRCPFRDVCDDPSDVYALTVGFDFDVPKRLRSKEWVRP